VHRGITRAEKRTRWMYVPTKRQPVGWVDVKLYLECTAVLLVCIFTLFFVWFAAGY
jgi:hypothetical protein